MQILEALDLPEPPRLFDFTGRVSYTKTAVTFDEVGGGVLSSTMTCTTFED